ncbi:MAG: phosphotransferase family protein, partial [Caulobacteraceae bacterium]|nr:phosphotransferase family protein [Caulobacteraceae bacterium]
LGAPFFIMEALEGRAPPDEYHSHGVLAEATPAQRERMWLSGIEAMAQLHRLSPEPFAFLGAPQYGDSAAAQELGRWDSFRRWGRIPALPAFSRARTWLEAHQPRAPGVGLAWGDARPGNQLFLDGRCVGLLDWETASLGGAESDLGWWLCYDALITEVAGAPRLEGLGGRDETIAAWENFAGRKAEAMEWHEVFGAYRFALVYERATALSGAAADAERPNPALVWLGRLTGW